MIPNLSQTSLIFLILTIESLSHLFFCCFGIDKSTKDKFEPGKFPEPEIDKLKKEKE